MQFDELSCFLKFSHFYIYYKIVCAQLLTNTSSFSSTTHGNEPLPHHQAKISVLHQWQDIFNSGCHSVEICLCKVRKSTKLVLKCIIWPHWVTFKSLHKITYVHNELNTTRSDSNYLHRKIAVRNLCGVIVVKTAVTILGKVAVSLSSTLSETVQLVSGARSSYWVKGGASTQLIALGIFSPH